MCSVVASCAPRLLWTQQHARSKSHNLTHGHSADAGSLCADVEVPKPAGSSAIQEDAHLDGASADVFGWEGSGHSLRQGDIERYSRQLILPALGVQGEQSAGSQSDVAKTLKPPLCGPSHHICLWASGQWHRLCRDVLRVNSATSTAGQVRLRQASVLVVGAGGLGCPAILYLAAAGIGRLGVVDRCICASPDAASALTLSVLQEFPLRSKLPQHYMPHDCMPLRDAVELSNIHRQVAHSEASVGRHKADSAAAAARAVNSTIQVATPAHGNTKPAHVQC